MKEKKEKKFVFYWLAALIFLAFIGFTFSGNDGLIRLIQLKRAKKELTEKNRSLLYEHLALMQELKSLKSLDAIEHWAHESLGLVYPDEVVYIIPK